MMQIDLPTTSGGNTQHEHEHKAGAPRPPLTGQDILLFAPGPWDEIWRNRHHLFTRLARHNRVIWIEPREAWRPMVRRLRQGEWRRGHFWRLGVSQPWPNIWVVHTPQFAPLTRRQPLAGATQALREWPVRRLCQHLGVRRPLLWLFHPTLWDQVGRWDEALTIYHLVDEYTAYTENPALQAELAADERQMLTRADLVLATSPALVAARAALHPRLHWVPNGVDAHAFAAAQPDPAFAHLPRPVLGYVGAINRKIDLHLLERVAARYPQATLLLVGPLDPRVDATAWAALRAHPNVCYAGPRPAAAVPAAMAACDVGLLPYLRTRWTEHINSLKLNEYLAVGLPVVALDLPMVAQARHLLLVASDHETFLDALALAPHAHQPDQCAARRAYAATQDWEIRVDQVADLIASGTKEKYGRK